MINNKCLLNRFHCNKLHDLFKLWFINWNFFDIAIIHNLGSIHIFVLIKIMPNEIGSIHIRRFTNFTNESCDNIAFFILIFALAVICHSVSIQTAFMFKITETILHIAYKSMAYVIICSHYNLSRQWQSRCWFGWLFGVPMMRQLCRLDVLWVSIAVRHKIFQID